MKYRGIEYHKQYVVATTMDEKGKVLRKQRVPTDRAAIRHYFKDACAEEPVTAVMEAGYGWEYFYDAARDLVAELYLAHPLKSRRQDQDERNRLGNPCASTEGRPDTQGVLAVF